MIVIQSKASTDLTVALARDVSRIKGPCIGCANCRGLCQTLIDALVLPDLILRGPDSAR